MHLYTAKPMQQQERDDHKHNAECEVSQFEIRLNIDFETWMKSKHQYSKQCKYEMSKILKVRPNMIKLENYREGSVIFTMKIWLFNASQWLRRHRYELTAIEIHDNFIEEMAVQDQISVKKQKAWHNATIITITKDDKGSHFRVRYNPKDDAEGNKPFLWKNTEWFYSKRGKLVEDDRLRYPEKTYKPENTKGEQGEIIWRAPEIKYRQSINHIQVNDHIFVNFGSMESTDWRRCKVVAVVSKYCIDRKQSVICWTVRDLYNGNMEVLQDWVGDDLRPKRYRHGNLMSDRVKFCDMRQIKILPNNRR